MCVSRYALCVLVVTVFLVSITYSRGKCNYSEILSSYRELIFIELLNLNLTGPYSSNNQNDRCPSGKVKHILRSIYGMTQLFKCQGGGKLYRELGLTVERMEQLISRNCRHTDLVKGQRKKSCKTGKVLKGRRKKKMKIIEALVLCWQKLQSTYVPKPQ
ncbi:hypothetical protein GJAV_G00190600 [Gymnothorax javanicus]|nr:hypothetical protein GJAV_G00190600 [Gymnothorax javanicus]